MVRNQKRGVEEQQQNANQTTVDEQDQSLNQEDEGQDRPFYQDITRGDTRSNPYSVDSEEEDQEAGESQEIGNRGRDLDEQDED